MKGQNNLQRNVIHAMDKIKLEEILNDEARKLVGYTMPILESMQATGDQKQSFKKILYSYKNNVCEMLFNEMIQNDQSKKRD